MENSSVEAVQKIVRYSLLLGFDKDNDTRSIITTTALRPGQSGEKEKAEERSIERSAVG